MTILFLGTSSGWPLPRLGCKCNLCLSNDSKDLRLRPAILIDDKILIDAPPDIYHQLNKFKIDTTKIEYIFLTHAHDDHIMGLYDLSHIYNKNKKINLIVTKGILSWMRRKLSASLFSFKIKEIKAIENYNLDNGFSFWFLPVIHSVETYAIKVKISRPFVYAPEFRRMQKSVKKELGDIDLAIIDGSSKSNIGQAHGHENIEEGLRFGKEINAKKIIFTNIGHKTDRHTQLVSFVKSKGGDKFDIAFDGMAVKL